MVPSKSRLEKSSEQNRRNGFDRESEAGEARPAGGRRQQRGEPKESGGGFGQNIYAPVPRVEKFRPSPVPVQACRRFPGQLLAASWVLRRGVLRRLPCLKIHEGEKGLQALAKTLLPNPGDPPKWLVEMERAKGFESCVQFFIIS